MENLLKILTIQVLCKEFLFLSVMQDSSNIVEGYTFIFYLCNFQNLCIQCEYLIYKTHPCFNLVQSSYIQYQ